MSIYQHFRPEEKPFIDQVCQWRDVTESRFQPKLTDFLDPRQQDIIRAIIGTQSDITVSFSGGFTGAERRRALFLPPYINAEINEHQITTFELDYPIKFATIEHRDLLGALIGLGVKREKFGDLIFRNNRIQFIVASEIAPFIRMNLTSVGKHGVSCEVVANDAIISPKHVWKGQSGVVSSLRLDAVIAEIYAISRKQALNLIMSSQVKVNWKVEEKPSFDLQMGDYISVRRAGRSKLQNIGNETKKGNVWIEYAILK